MGGRRDDGGKVIVVGVVKIVGWLGKGRGESNTGRGWVKVGRPKEEKGKQYWWGLGVSYA